MKKVLALCFALSVLGSTASLAGDDSEPVENYEKCSVERIDFQLRDAEEAIKIIDILHKARIEDLTVFDVAYARIGRAIGGVKTDIECNLVQQGI